ncbi:hypothetical protein BRADI_2g17233v3 [Brachypodium distachyon]|uniref:Uncharacterized protein n=1 Tax=Brachypodium distachyon TaxID=15368 RepID=A0A2K2D8Y8_BRADI|nr:hypothetical protein BRADI_2g17233v3 [Brachypodium distachyon]
MTKETYICRCMILVIPASIHVHGLIFSVVPIKNFLLFEDTRHQVLRQRPRFFYSSSARASKDRGRARRKVDSSIGRRKKERANFRLGGCRDWIGGYVGLHKEGRIRASW